MVPADYDGHHCLPQEQFLTLPSKSQYFLMQVLCSVDDVTSVLGEIQRVVKPGGYFFFFEHVSASKGSVKLFAQKLLTPLQQSLADGCHLDRNTLDYINSAGFTHVEASQLDLEGLGILSPHIVGIATV